MPNHVHLVVCPRPDVYAISDFLTAVKLPVTRRAASFVRREAPHSLPQMTDRRPNGESAVRFWQRGGGYDRNLTEPAKLYAEIDYVHMNPVRKGLVERPEDWPWSSAVTYAGESDQPLRIAFDSLPNDPRLPTTSR